MNKFVEITVDGEKCIINASAVQLVKSLPMKVH